MKTKADIINNYNFDGLYSLLNELGVKYFDDDMNYVSPSIDFLKKRVIYLFDNFDKFKTTDNVAVDYDLQLMRDSRGNYSLHFIADRVEACNIRTLLNEIDYKRLKTVIRLNGNTITNCKNERIVNPTIDEIMNTVRLLCLENHLLKDVVDVTVNGFRFVKYTDTNNIEKMVFMYLVKK